MKKLFLLAVAASAAFAAYDSVYCIDAGDSITLYVYQDGRVCFGTDLAGEASYSEHGIVTRVASKRIQYDSQGRVRQVGSLTLQYDEKSRIAKVRGTRISYDKEGRVQRIGSAPVYYYSDGSVKRVRGGLAAFPAGFTPVLAFMARGDLIALADSNGRFAYGLMGAGTVSYYDDGYVRSVGGVKVTLDSEDRLARVGSASISYDDDGSVIRIAGNKVSYDKEGRIISIGGSRLYYDDKGRVRKAGSGVQLVFRGN